MSNPALNWAFDAPVKGTDKAVLVVLANHANDAGECFPGIERIIRHSGFGRTAVLGSLQRLEKSGLIRTFRSSGRGSRYVITGALVSADEAATRTGPADEPVRQTNQSAKRATPVRQADHTGSPGGPEPLLNPQRTPTSSLRSEGPPGGVPASGRPRDLSSDVIDGPERLGRVEKSAPLDARTALWAEGVPILCRLTGKPERACRSFLGRLLRDLNDDCAVLLAILRDAEDDRPADPFSWLAAAVAARKRPKFRNGFLTLIAEEGRRRRAPDAGGPNAHMNSPRPQIGTLCEDNPGREGAP